MRHNVMLWKSFIDIFFHLYWPHHILLSIPDQRESGSGGLRLGGHAQGHSHQNHDQNESDRITRTVPSSGGHSGDNTRYIYRKEEYHKKSFQH